MSERYARLFTLPENLYAAGAPVVIAAGALLKDNQTGKVLAQLKLRSIDSRRIKAATVCVIPFDTIGNPIGDAVRYQYLDLNVARNEAFGQKAAIALPDSATRSFAVRVEEIVFATNTLWKSMDESWEPLSAPMTLECALKDSELVKQYRIKYGTDCKYTPVFQKDLWYCACGALNHKEESVCHHCQKSASTLMSVDLGVLATERDSRVAAEKKKAAEDKAIADAKAKKVKKMAMIFIPIAIVLTVAAILISNAVRKNQEEAARLEAYQKAVVLMEQGEYDDAIEIFEDLGDYLDSPQKALEVYAAMQEAIQEAILDQNYNDAIAALNQGNYNEAYHLFQKLGEYRDSPEYLEKFKALLVLETQPNMYEITYTYANGQLVQRASKALGSTYAYDGGQTVVYEYSREGILTRTTGVGFSNNNKITESIEYDIYGNEIKSVSLWNGSVYQHLETVYTYYDNGKIQSYYVMNYNLNGKGEAVGTLSRTVTYSEDGSMSTTEYSNGLKCITKYDAYGNMVSYQYTNAKGEAESLKTYKNEYDPNGNLIAITNPDGTKQVYRYEDNLLISFTYYRADGTIQYEVFYQYDYFYVP